jgi:hypothetical protein
VLPPGRGQLKIGEMVVDYKLEVVVVPLPEITTR